MGISQGLFNTLGEFPPIPRDYERLYVIICGTVGLTDRGKLDKPGNDNKKGRG
jgi:hypothetical protein